LIQYIVTKEVFVRLFLSDAEFSRRKALIRAKLEERNLDALCLFSPTQVFYLTGFSFIATERPIGLVYEVDKDSVCMFIPLLEREHAEESHVDEILTYNEYPGDTHPMVQFSEYLAQAGLDSKRIGVDSDGYGGGWGYVGPKLSEVVSAEVVLAKDLIEKAMWIKSTEEIELIQESCKWGNLAHQLLQDYSAVGAIETDVSIKASHAASIAMINTLGPNYRSTSWGAFAAHAGFRGQIGAQSAVPHAITTNARLKDGDILVTGASADVGGYTSELERTMVLGEPTDKQIKFFGLMLDVQNLAFDLIKPGKKCSDIDKAVREFYEQNGIRQYWRHHTGHNLGFGMHESPFFDAADHTTIEPGMVFSVEPGIYVPGFAGFRHSDTILVTDDGMRMLTYYPRDLESLSIPV
jgi:Xaa-Pro dipeptidase